MAVSSERLRRGFRILGIAAPSRTPRVTTLPFSLSAGGATQILIPSGLSALFGSATLTHDGPPGAITAGTYMVNASVGANLRWPFRETGSYGATDGK